MPNLKSRGTIKICGITSVDDALTCVQAGADYIGLIFAPGSPRCLSKSAAREICQAIEGKAKTVGVFQDAASADVQAMRDELQLDLVQLHGSEPASECLKLKPSIKAVALNDNLNIEGLDQYGDQLIIFDRPKSGQPHLPIEEFARRYKSAQYKPARFLFAGGLDAENVGKQIEILKDLPGFAGVDVASGVESSAGVKDVEKVRLFCRQAKEAYER